MEILKINENKKLEIYAMRLNMEKARRFREEQSEKIRFLKIKMNHYDDFEKMLSPHVFHLIYHSCCCDLIFGCKNLEEIPYYHVCTYPKEEMVALQKDFLDQYVMSGLNRYPFLLDFSKFDKTSLRAYLFLVLTLSFEEDFCCMNHVVSFPNEAIVMYLLERGDIKQAISFLDPKYWGNIVACFDFFSVSSFRSLLIQNYSTDGMLEDDFIRRQRKMIALHKNIVQHMKNDF